MRSARCLVARRYLGDRLPHSENTLRKFNFPSATHTAREIGGSLVAQTVTLHGHIHRKPRIMATKGFADVRDVNGDVIQIQLDPAVAGELSVLAARGPEDCVSVTGSIQEKQKRKDAPNEPPQYEIVVSDLQLLNAAGNEVAQLDKLKHTAPLPPQYRHLQLRMPYLQNALRTRSKVAHLIRNILTEKHDFTEIETPLLFKSTPEGAREFLVPMRSPDSFYALPQSPQQYKQILMSSGFTRYFQIAKCFRDEDLRADRQPEFTQVDLEMSFINNKDQITAVVDDVIFNVWTKIAKMPLYKLNDDGRLHRALHEPNAPVFNKLTYHEAMSKYGIDKPDLRSSLTLASISDSFEWCHAPESYLEIEACVLKGAFVPGESFKTPKALLLAENYPSRKPVILTINTEDEARGWYKKFVEKGMIKTKPNFDEEKLQGNLGLAPGDILAFSVKLNNLYENPLPCGKFRSIAIDAFPGKWNRPLVEADGSVVTDYDASKVFVGAWVVDFPLFTPVETNESNFPAYSKDKLTATHHPFTMANSEDYALLQSDPLKVRGEHYDLVMNGVEVGGGSRRVHDAELQTYIFKEILKIDNQEEVFGHLITALSHGCPPHGGLALGFDRLCAMVIGSSSIRDVIAFPKLKSGRDPVVNSPTSVPETTLNEYFISKLQK